MAGNIKRPTPSTRIERKPFDKESLAWLCSKYYSSAEYKQQSGRTRYVRRATLDHICAADGEKPYKLLLPKHIRARRDARADRPESANGIIKALRQVFAFAVENDYVVSNPAKSVPYLKAKGDGHHTWTLEEVERFEKKHSIGTTARLALALYTGQRKSDAALLAPKHVKDGWLHFTQFKGRERKPITLDIPVVDELQAIIDATACGKETFLLNGLGRPFTANGFGTGFMIAVSRPAFPAVFMDCERQPQPASPSLAPVSMRSYRSPATPRRRKSCDTPGLRGRRCSPLRQWRVSIPGPKSR